MPDYFRRSRTGCSTCRKLRIKCDEGRPSCARCHSRSIVCEGYPPRLKWMGEATPTDGMKPNGKATTGGLSPESDNQLSPMLPLNPGTTVASPQSARKWVETHLSRLQISRNPDPLVLKLESSRDRMFFDHWFYKSSRVTHPDDPQSFKVQTMYLSAILETQSTLLPSLLAASAAHMAVLGAVPIHELLLIKHRAIKAVRNSLSIGWHNKAPVAASSSVDDQSCSHPGVAFDLNLIAASFILAGIEVMQGTHLSQIIPILHGTASLIAERNRYLDCYCNLPTRKSPHSSRTPNELETAMFRHIERMMAYFDIMSCVPCPREPFARSRSWLEDPVFTDDTGVRPTIDPVMGYCSNILALTGDCSALIYAGYTGSISKFDYQKAQESFFDSLSQSMLDIPLPYVVSRAQETQQNKLSNEEACAFAAHAHGLASQIFLMRSTDYRPSSGFIGSLVTRLRYAIKNVPCDSAAITLMLWPYWVLGCESSASLAERQEVVNLFSEMFERQGILNISTCLQTLQTRIWTLDLTPIDGYGDDMSDANFAIHPITKTPMSYRPVGSFRIRSEWVEYCWEQNIQLILA